MEEKIGIPDIGPEVKKRSREEHEQAISPSLHASADQSLNMQSIVGNQEVQRLLKTADFQEKSGSEFLTGTGKRSTGPDRTTADGLHRDLDPVGTEKQGMPAGPEAAPRVGSVPTGIEKTGIDQQKRHFGAHYKHTLKSSGGSLEGIVITEKVTNVKDDFKTGLPGVELGKITTRINKQNEIGDDIWMSFGSIAPAVERLRKQKKPGESLIGEMIDRQELYYWENAKPAGWKKFVDDNKILFRLYDLPGLVVLTIDNDFPADPEEFTPFAPKSEKKECLDNETAALRQLHDISLSQHQIGNQTVQRQMETQGASSRWRRPSKFIPDLDAFTVEALSDLPKIQSPDSRQELIGIIVKDRQSKGMDLTILEKGRPVYVSRYPDELLKQGGSPENQGYTIAPDSPPVNTGKKPLVLIGPTAFGKATDELEHRIVLLYTTILHEYQHALQWQKPAETRAKSKSQREVEAYFFDLEKSKSSGLFMQKLFFEYVFEEAVKYWSDFVRSEEWKKLPIEDRSAYARRYVNILDIAEASLGKEHFLVKERNKKNTVGR